MKKFYLAIFIILFTGCGGGSSSQSAPSEPVAPKTIKIMPLGDSITWDWYFYDSRTDAERSGYRNYLWYKLKTAGVNIDFVGSRTTGGAIVPSFDGDNEGHIGYTSFEIADNVYGYLNAKPADIVLLQIGTNDTSISTAGVEKILDEINRFEADSKTHIQVIFALIPSNGEDPQRVSLFNAKLNEVAQSRIGNGDDILVVDMENGAGFNYNRDFIDLVHPNDCGYEKMANVWFVAVTGLASPGITHAACN